jgi:hypothetical protein
MDGAGKFLYIHTWVGKTGHGASLLLLSEEPELGLLYTRFFVKQG